MNSIYIKRLIILIPLFYSLSADVGAQNATVSLGQCLQKAREYHPYYQDRQRIEKSGELKHRNIQSAWLPQMSLNAQATYQSDATKVDIPFPGVNISGTPLDQYKITVDINQAIYDGGITAARKKLTESNINAELQQNESDIFKVNEQVTAVYFNALLLQVNRNLYQNMLDDLMSREQKISSGVRNGILIQSDHNNLKVEILKTRQLLSELEFAYASSRGILSELTGDTAMLSSELLLPEIEITAMDSVNRPELKLFDIQKQMLDGSKGIVSSERMPRLFAFTQAGYGRPGLNMLKDDFQPFYIVGLKFQWSIFDWNKTSREKSIYTIQQEVIDSRKENYLRNLKISGSNEITRIQQLQSALAVDGEIFELRKEIATQSEKRLEQGMITVADYLTDYNAMIKATLQLETHKVQLMHSKVNYLIINGIL